MIWTTNDSSLMRSDQPTNQARAADHNGHPVHLVCNGCREPMSPKAKICPNCNASIETWRGKFMRRVVGFFGLLLLFVALSSGSTFGLLFFGPIGLVMTVAAAYYYFTAPVHRLDPRKRLRER